MTGPTGFFLLMALLMAAAHARQVPPEPVMVVRTFVRSTLTEEIQNIDTADYDDMEDEFYDVDFVIASEQAWIIIAIGIGIALFMQFGFQIPV